MNMTIQVLEFQCFAADFMMYFMNTIMLGCKSLMPEIFVKNRKFFIELNSTLSIDRK